MSEDGVLIYFFGTLNGMDKIINHSAMLELLLHFQSKSTAFGRYSFSAPQRVGG